MSIDWSKAVTAEDRQHQQDEIGYQSWKAARHVAVAAITVEVVGRIYDGDETSQNRMARVVAAADSLDDVVSWTLADNSMAFVTALELKEALRLAGLKQTEIWNADRPAIFTENT